jgi:hypothetical protein
MSTAATTIANGKVPSVRPIYSTADETNLSRDQAPRVPAEVTIISDARMFAQPVPRIPPRRASIEELFTETEGLPPELPNARRMLASCIRNVKDALTSIREGDIVLSDDKIAHVIVSFPELFCCRTLGDGFGMVINALQGAIENKRGAPLDIAQLQSILRALEKIHSEPFLKSSSAVDAISALEESGLNPEPPAYEYLLDWLDGTTASVR